MLLMELPVIVDPVSLLRQWSRLPGGKRGRALMEMHFHYLEILLPIETRRRLIMGAVGNSLMALEKEEIATVLRSVIEDSGYRDLVDDWYGYLLEWQSQEPKLEPVSPREAHAVALSPHVNSAVWHSRRRTVDLGSGEGEERSE
jgi:hypothetical protein